MNKRYRATHTYTPIVYTDTTELRERTILYNPYTHEEDEVIFYEKGYRAETRAGRIFGCFMKDVKESHSMFIPVTKSSNYENIS